MNRYLIIFLILLIAVPASAYFGGRVFGSQNFGKLEFGKGEFGEGNAVISVPTGDRITTAGTTRLTTDGTTRTTI